MARGRGELAPDAGLIRPLAAGARQEPYGAAVVLPTLLRPSLIRAVRSIFVQDFAGRIQILVGVDRAEGDRAQLATLAAECPPHMALDLFDPGYSTSVRHGGLYPNKVTGSLRTLLTYAANSRYVAYLDDDNWWAPDHLASLQAAIDGHDWSWSQRWFVDPEGAEPICIDEWESVGPDAGVFKEKFGGFVDPSSLMIDKLACHEILPAWSLTPFADGRGSDRLIFDRLRRGHAGKTTGRATSFYTINPNDIVHLARLQYFRQKGVELPSDRRAGVTRLARLAEAWRPAPPLSKATVGFKADNPVLAELLRKLKPAEILVLGAGDGAVAMALARTARAIGLACLVLATGVPSETDEENLRRRIVAAGLEESLTALPTRFGKDTDYLAERHVLVDLVQLGPGASGTAPWRTAWPLLRAGGFLIGRGKPDSSLEKFVTETGSMIVRVEFPGAGPRWVVEKGLGEVG
ncbi:MAG TPA: hypothetical protein VGV37_15755 [Aliidongia sp.]|uniref:hypothetical protein n=1 Tax=Aliidongia sp. TaxID=1914230 RepID=UPI002DDD47E5|nr:hypothetical protein [Aliidongia sp.]HEV2675977.1 hypothetical protein [Aliidongia sp.]